MNKSGSAQHFRDQLHRNHELVERLSEPDFPYPLFASLQDWQRNRLRTSYADLFAQDRYREAIIFFLEELYGGKDVSRRDHDVSRVYPVMVRVLPAETLTALGDAFELQAVSLELDMAMTRNWQAGGQPGELNPDRYCELYRRTGCLALREKQIELIGSIGLDLAVAVKNSMVDKLVRVLRMPAKITGFETLQLFLERGLHAFRVLGEPGEFLETITNNESAIMCAILDRKPSPFMSRK